MREFLLILLFSKVVLLTAAPIDLDGKIELKIDEPIKAITTGASIKIDVSTMISWQDKEGIMEFRERIAKSFPIGAITATLFDEKNNPITLIYNGNHLVNKESVMLSLDCSGGVPTNVEFNRLIVSSKIKLSQIKIWWNNCRH